jgi:hypothetical protein
MKDKWIKKWQVNGSNGHVWTVSKSKTGEWGCSCPVWKFRRQECHHILSVKDNETFYEKEEANGGKHICPGNVPEVTEKDGILLYPLVPFGPSGVPLAATIICDLNRMGADREQLKRYGEKMFPKTPMRDILGYVETHGRYVYTEFIEGQGWTNPIFKKNEDIDNHCTSPNM